MNKHPVTYTCDGVFFVTHVIKFDGNDIADVVVSREGMYYKLQCRCRNTNQVPYNLYLLTKNTSILIGKCPPGRQVVKRISMKTAEELHFAAELCDSSLHKISDSMEPNHIKKLPQAYLRQDNDAYYIGFK